MSKLIHLLLSLPSPDKFCLDYLDSIVNDFLWCGKPAQIRNEIVEAEIKYGSLKTLNLPSKMSWAKRFLKSNSKWTIFPKDMELEKAFDYGLDYLEKEWKAPFLTHSGSM